MPLTPLGQRRRSTAKSRASRWIVIRFPVPSSGPSRPRQPFHPPTHPAPPLSRLNLSVGSRQFLRKPGRTGIPISASGARLITQTGVGAENRYPRFPVNPGIRRSRTWNQAIVSGNRPLHNPRPHGESLAEAPAPRRVQIEDPMSRAHDVASRRRSCPASFDRNSIPLQRRFPTSHTTNRQTSNLRSCCRHPLPGLCSFMTMHLIERAAPPT